MMFTAFNTECDSSSRCSTASPGYYPSPAGSYSSIESPQSQDYTELTASSASFIPTVTAISTSPDLQWMVQPLVSSVAPSHRAHPYSSSSPSPAYASSAMKSASKVSKRGRVEQLSIEEEEKRRIRRERNKQAAAKCRNRRRELTDTLQAETDQLEDEKSVLQNDIANLLKEKERLELILASHQPTCKLPAHGESDEEEDDMNSALQEPPASPQLLSILENAKTSEGSSVMRETPSGQDMDSVPCIPAAAILGNSNILLCSSAEESLQDLKGDDLDDLVPSLYMAGASEKAASVPDIDLSGPICLPDWETLYKSVASDLESLSTPLMSSSPTCSNQCTVFSFNDSEIESIVDNCEALRGSLGSDSLNSPTLLVL
uniref:Protein c-Fos n=1 Tax=Nothobranchius korthausae TaxID=1143690 RepID=A0A1A8HB80_9TELE